MTAFESLLTAWPDHRSRLPDLLDGRTGVVLVGAGKVGREFLAALQASHVPIFAFTDNDAGKWGQVVAGVPVIAPDEAVRRFGPRGVFLVTIGRVGTGAAQVVQQFTSLGADRVLHFIEAIPLVPSIWRHFFLAPDVFGAGDRERCAEAYALFQDQRSKDLFTAHLRWRTTLDASALPIPDYDNQYFPPDVIAPRHCASFVDVGAYTGDTLSALTAFAGGSLRTYHGFEPDPRNYETLLAEARALTERHPAVRVVTRCVAIGAAHQQLSFAGDGSATSQVSASGSDRVECVPLDSVEMERPTYLKIDVEGAEDDVLTGGTRTLRQWKPTVAIATYHRPKDLFDLPLRLAGHAPDYRFHLRSHGDAGIDLVCYAVREPAAS